MPIVAGIDNPECAAAATTALPSTETLSTILSLPCRPSSVSAVACELAGDRDRIRDWLGGEPGLRVLDVGSGSGKFCLVLGASGPGKVTGVEQRPFLHQAAEAAAFAFTPRVRPGDVLPPGDVLARGTGNVRDAAHLLAAAAKAENPDLILTGLQSDDLLKDWLALRWPYPTIVQAAVIPYQL